MANNVEPDEMWYSAASHLGLHCLLRLSVRIHMVNTVVAIIIRSTLATYVVMEKLEKLSQNYTKILLNKFSDVLQRQDKSVLKMLPLCVS